MSSGPRQKNCQPKSSKKNAKDRQSSREPLGDDISRKQDSFRCFLRKNSIREDIARLFLEGDKNPRNHIDFPCDFLELPEEMPSEGLDKRKAIIEFLREDWNIHEVNKIIQKLELDEKIDLVYEMLGSLKAIAPPPKRYAHEYVEDFISIIGIVNRPEVLKEAVGLLSDYRDKFHGFFRYAQEWLPAIVKKGCVNELHKWDIEINALISLYLDSKKQSKVSSYDSTNQEDVNQSIDFGKFEESITLLLENCSSLEHLQKAGEFVKSYVKVYGDPTELVGDVLPKMLARCDSISDFPKWTNPKIAFFNFLRKNKYCNPSACIKREYNGLLGAIPSILEKCETPEDFREWLKDLANAIGIFRESKSYMAREEIKGLKEYVSCDLTKLIRDSPDIEFFREAIKSISYYKNAKSGLKHEVGTFVEIIGQCPSIEYLKEVTAILVTRKVDLSRHTRSVLPILFQKCKPSEMQDWYDDTKGLDPKIIDKFKTIEEVRSWKSLQKNGFIPTIFLARELSCFNDRKQTIREWREILASFNRGRFDPENELHRNLEYTRFRKIVGDERVRKHIKNDFSFEDYLSIFKKDARAESEFSDEQFEINCVAYEAKLLRDFILKVKEKAAEQGRKVLVVPNLSYGYLPTSPLIEELSKKGVEFCIGAKVGSTESHHNKEVINSRLFKGQREKIMNEQPVIIVIDGTQHLIARDSTDKAARYPDAYQGYLNQTIAINDASGFQTICYSKSGKTSEDMSRLRSVEEFRRLVKVYQHVSKGKARQSFSFHLWNTAGMNLIIRNNKEKIEEIDPFDPENLSGPSIIFCNVGLLDNQIPDFIQEGFEGVQHTPAYFDDSGRIIRFDFGFDEYGVRYLNRLETEVKKAYDRMNGNQVSISDRIIPEIIRYMNSWKSRFTGNVEEAA